MLYQPASGALPVFLVFVLSVIGLSFYLGRKGQTAKGYYAAHGQVHWFVNGVAFAGDYLSAASFLGICGMIAFYGYDGFLYSIGYLAGWIVALFVIAEPIKKLGKFTFADALDSRFNSRGIKLAVGISTLVISVFYLIPQMVGAGALIKPLLGLPHWAGVAIVGVTVMIIVVTAGMVSTTWVQFIKGSLLVLFCAILTLMIFQRGLVAETGEAASTKPYLRANIQAHGNAELPVEGAWTGKPYVRFGDPSGRVLTYRVVGTGAEESLWLCQTITKTASGEMLVNGMPQTAANDLRPVGTIQKLSSGRESTGALGPISYLNEIEDSQIVSWPSEKIEAPDGAVTTVYYPKVVAGTDVLRPGGSPTFKGIRSDKPTDKLDFLSLMLALFCGTASLPHILIRYYTVKDRQAARKSTVVGIAAIGIFYVLTLYLGLGAMTSGALDPTNSNMAAPLLARTYGDFLFAVISAIAFTTVLGTVSGLLMAGSGAIAHDLIESTLRIPMNDHQKVVYGKVAAVLLGIGAMVLGVLFEKLNVTFLVGWAFNIAASANLPALVMRLFWKGTTRQGIITAVWVGMISSLGWILLSSQVYKDVYHIDPKLSIVPFSQPGLVTIPLGFLVLVVVSMLTGKTGRQTPESAAATN